jgi:N-acetyl-anhydromuramyl-L-alanine amidase AmpD
MNSFIIALSLISAPIAAIDHRATTHEQDGGITVSSPYTKSDKQVLAQLVSQYGKPKVNKIVTTATMTGQSSKTLYSWKHDGISIHYLLSRNGTTTSYELTYS